jgi:pimeloyl-ACP methyl ester carboxylesterase
MHAECNELGENAMELAYRTEGEGPPLLLVHGGGEDKEMHRHLVEAIAARGFRVIAYDRRGTGGSTREHWPDGGVPQHADDAANLLRTLGAAPATVIGFSSGGVVALGLAQRHPDVVERVIAWEPALATALPYADDLYPTLNAPYERYLEEHPGDWVGGYHVVLDVLSEGRADHDAPLVRQSERNAEAMLRDDGVHIVWHRLAADRLPADKITLAVTEGASPLHAEIAERLGEALGRPPVVLAETHEHEDYLLRPTVAAAGLVGLLEARTVPVG